MTNNFNLFINQKNNEKFPNKVIKKVENPRLSLLTFLEICKLNLNLFTSFILFLVYYFLTFKLNI